MVNVQKSLKGASSEADFWHGENIDPAEKKALNSDVGWSPLHGEIGLLKLKNRNSCYFSQFLLKELSKTQ